ncbi:hypothetical protein JCM10450v2_007250 [Rhodotorula kratochvilovae]
MSPKPGFPPPVYAQPPPQRGMAVPNGSTPPQRTDGEWWTGLCVCEDGACGQCCFAFWCPCFAYGKYKQRLDALTETGAPLRVEACSPAALLWATVQVLTLSGWLFDFSARGRLRARYGIRGGACGDCCAAWACNPCVQAQHAREIGREEEALWAGGAGAGMQLQGY